MDRPPITIYSHDLYAIDQVFGKPVIKSTN